MEIEYSIDGVDIQINVSEDNINIKDSYLVPKREFRKILSYIYENYPNRVTEKRSVVGLCFEWAVHNFLYGIGYEQERTKDVDLDYPQSWKMRIGYGVGGLLVWVFVK